MRFYSHFAATYGTIVLALRLPALVSGGRVNDLANFLSLLVFSLGMAMILMRREASEVRTLKERIRVLEVQLARDVFGDGGAA
jgi:hypothetical protein